MIGLIPLVGSDIHFKSLNEFSCIDEVLFSQIKLTDFGIMSSDLLVVRSTDLRRLVSNQLNSSVPFSGTDCGFNSLGENSSLNEMLNG